MATVASKKTEDFIGSCIAMASDMLKMPTRHLWLDYDEEADVLYMSFRKPQRATKTIEMDDVHKERWWGDRWFDDPERKQ